MNTIYLKLKEAKDKGYIVALYSEPYDQTAFDVGFIDLLTDKEVRIRSISPEGYYAGYEIRTLDKIYRIDIDSNYLKKITFLFNRSENFYREVELSDTIGNEGILFSTLEEAKEKKLIVVIWTEDEDDSVIGYIDGISEDVVKLMSIDDYGKEDGYIYLSIRSITDMDCNSHKCQLLSFLNKNWIQNQ
jgi:hypothetical protein